MEDTIKVIYKKNQPVESRKSNYPGFKRETVVLPKGYKSGKKAAPLECTIVFERDIPVHLRDGTIVYTDIFPPETSKKVPAIVAWSPCGKNGSGGQHLTMFSGKLGITNISELMKWEGPEPDYWCKYGYAVCYDGKVSSHEFLLAG